MLAWRDGWSGCASGYKARVMGRHADTYEKTLPGAPIVAMAGGRSSMPVTKKPPCGGLSNLAERGGFEPPRRYKRLPDFESGTRSEEQTSELQSLMRISYAVFCLKKKK